MKLTHGPHVSTTRNHCFSYEEETKNFLPLGSSKDLSFISSKSSKFYSKFKNLSILTHPPYVIIDSLERDTKDSAGPSRGDDDCPDENEFEQLNPQKVSFMNIDYILPGFYF